MSIRKFRAARINSVLASEYVGQHGDIFWDEDLGTFRLSDGATPGGTRVVLNAQDINLAFGDFVANVNNISTIHPNEDFNIISNGTGTVNVVGQFHVHPTDSGTGLQLYPYFQINNYGEVIVTVPVPDQHDGGFTVTGNPNGAYIDPNNTGVMIAVTGQPNDPSRIYNDGQNTYAAYIGRRYNTSTAAPTQVKTNDIISRVGATSYTDTGWPTISTVRLDMVATQDQTKSALGSRLEFWTTPTNSNAIARVGYVDNTNGITATQFTGNVVGTTASFTGNITATNVIANTMGTLTGNVYGTVMTAAQPNITTVGTLTGLAVNNLGITTDGNIVTKGNIRYDVSTNNSTVTQLTDKTTTVTCNGRTGQITTSSASLAKGTAVTFTVNNSYITAATDVPVVVFQSGATTNSYAVSVTRVQVGSFNITISNNGAGPLSDTIIINFAVIKVA